MRHLTKLFELHSCDVIRLSNIPLLLHRLQTPIVCTLWYIASTILSLFYKQLSTMLLKLTGSDQLSEDQISDDLAFTMTNRSVICACIISCVDVDVKIDFRQIIVLPCSISDKYATSTFKAYLIVSFGVCQLDF